VDCPPQAINNSVLRDKIAVRINQDFFMPIS
jgi:hypothetical protein